MPEDIQDRIIVAGVRFMDFVIPSLVYCSHGLFRTNWQFFVIASNLK